MLEKVSSERGAITDSQWFSLINRVMDCVYKELQNESGSSSYSEYYGPSSVSSISSSTSQESEPF